MKNLLQKSFMPMAAAVLLAGSCSEGETVYDWDGSSAPVIERIEPVGPAYADRVTVRITPGSGAAGYEFAIGTESDYGAFVTGTLDRQKAEGDRPAEHTFAGLERNSGYIVYARALREDGSAGPASNAAVRTFGAAIEVAEQFAGDRSLAFTISPSVEYQSVEYALATTPDRTEEFETPGLTTDLEIIRESDVFREFTATYFDLTPDTPYYLYVRGKDRYGNLTETLVTESGTRPADEVPSVEISSDIADFWITRYTFTPNSLTGMYFLLYVEAGALDGFYMSMKSYGGNYLEYLLSQSTSGKNLYDTEQTLPYVHENQDLERAYEIYALVFDREGNPASVVRKSWRTPSYVPDAGTAEVGIRVEPASNGATYYWSPNDATVGFYYETFTAELIDGHDQYDPGAKDEQWVKDFFTARAMSYLMGGHWNYRYLPELGYWEDRWTDDSGEDLEPGTELIVYVMPLNANGLVDGIGTLTSQRYSTPLQ